jgi:hypothetical protein
MLNDYFYIRVQLCMTISEPQENMPSQHPDVRDAVEIKFEGDPTHNEDLNDTLGLFEEVRKGHTIKSV